MSYKLYDYECSVCKRVFEALSDDISPLLYCGECKGIARRIIGCSRVNISNQDAKWVRESASALLDMESARMSSDRTERELALSPNRENLNRYMRTKGIRMVENEKGGPPVYKKPPGHNTEEIAYKLYQRHRERSRIDVGARP